MRDKTRNRTKYLNPVGDEKELVQNEMSWSHHFLNIYDINLYFNKI